MDRSEREPQGAGHTEQQPGLEHSVADGVATVVITNPAKRNAMTTAMWEELPALLQRLAADPAVRVLVLTGAGDTFCAGADITTLMDPGGSPQALAVAAEEALAAARKRILPPHTVGSAP